MSSITPLDDNFPEEVPETISRFIPGTPAMQKHVKYELARNGFQSDVRNASEIIQRFGLAGNTYDFPGRNNGQPNLVRLTIKDSLKIQIALTQLSDHNIHVLELWEDQNSDSPGLWVLIEYETLTKKKQTIFDRLNRFTRDVSSSSPWDEMGEFIGLSDKDIRALKQYLSAHIIKTVQMQTVKMGLGTSRIGWTPDLKSYARPGYMRGGYRGLYAKDAAYPWTATGDLATQKKILLGLFWDSPRALMVAGFATAGIIMRHLGIPENYIIGLVGPDSSSLGKSSLQTVIKSFYGKPDTLQNFDSTSKALRATAIYGNDSVVLIDEIGAAGTTDSAERDAFVYGLAAGVPRDYLKRVNGEFQPKGEQIAARYTAIISGEESLINRQKARTGIRIRYSDMPVTMDKKLWGFDDNHRAEQAASDLKEHYGHIFPELVELLIASPDAIAQIKDYYRNELEIVRERCNGEKQKRKAKIVALARAGLIALFMVLDPDFEQEDLLQQALKASDELLDEFKDAETTSNAGNAIASLPVALAQHLAVLNDSQSGTASGAKMPTREMIGSMWPNETRYRKPRFGDISGIANEADGEKIKGTVIVLDPQLCSDIVKRKLGIDLDMLVTEAIKHGLMKLRPRTDRDGYRKTSMSKFIISENGNTRTKSAIEIIVPDEWEAPEIQAIDNENNDFETESTPEFPEHDDWIPFDD